MVFTETITDMQSWCRTWPLNGSNRIRAKTKTSQDTQRSLQKFLEPERKPKVIYTDNSLEFGKACEDLSWNHCTSTPHRSETNGIAEKAVRRVKEGTSAVLMQSGLLSAKRHRFIIWWEDALWKTFWATISRTDYSICFIGWESSYNCEGPVKNPSIWKESLTWILPWIRIVRGVNLEGWRTDRRPWGVGDDGRIGNLLEKTQCERGDISQRKKRLHFSSHKWTNQNPSKRSGPENIHLGTASTTSRRENIDFLGDSEGSLPQPQDSPDAGEAINDFGSMSGSFIYRHHVEPRVKTLLAERGIIPYSTEIHWRNQNYSYEFGCQAREAHRWLLEHWWVSRLVWFLDKFHTIYHTRRKSSWRIYLVRGRFTRKQLTSRPDHLWPEL